MATPRNVSVEVSGPLIQALTCFNGSEPGVRLDRLNDRSLENPDNSFGVTRTFNIVPIPNGGQGHFALQSKFNHAYLGFNVRDRRLMMRHVQFPPPESFRFAYSLKIPHCYDEDGAPVHIMAADAKPVNDPNSASTEFQLFVRPFQGLTPASTVDESWKQQLALISVLGEKKSSDEDEYSEVRGFGGGGSTDIDNSEQLAMVAEMQKTGDLRTAINTLAEEKYDDATNQGVSPDATVKVAQLLCIMDQCVYMRDIENEERIHSELQPHAAEIKEAVRHSRPISKATLDAMMKAQVKGDRATQKIQEVASRMGLDYLPICNFSSDGSLLRNGPYCGAFYGHSEAKKPFIVVAFKGTGRLKEWITDIKFNMKDAVGSSPLKGMCHIGFFDGVFKDFPCDLSSDKSIRLALPFQMMRNQLWKLERKVLAKTFPFGLRVQAWVTGHSLGGAYATNCWAGMLADMHFMHTTIRDLITFGSPRVGDKTYATYAGSLKGFRKSWRFVNGNDLVARAPCVTFWLKSYYHIDSMVNISPVRIALGNSELRTNQAMEVATEDATEDATEEGMTDESDLEVINQDEYHIQGDIFGIADHSLKKYWASLRNGTLENHNPWP
ncbi:Alpha/Beta hydrolase protein [Annulohypoxylon maeteangense]|uniref:Alpha/Beta hydrolase protein n=1 Tax=Annulohypoxylon maeteangense TaxID=1927788 RepID=UPI0020080996|nr:Alpha/Beta hydrolase protein [Annulohypoxylon maeteangense]KAI0883540.1 Alpha/Beta hydrolase protein [Annulohypoxylon maeteangense]